MKKMIVVSKTHLDLGFTDYAENIRQKYINQFIPGAIDLAHKVNKNGYKNFVWTTGSWIIKEALEHGTKEQQETLKQAIRDGDIVPHAYPFTTHTELLDEDSLDYGMSIVEELDKLRGRKTVAAKMTDVPGHTIGLVRALAKHGIKLLHIGVNGASALAEIPPCFLWKSGDSEVVVVYSGDYGGAYESDVVDEILYFDHTLDNHGAPSPEKTMAKIEKLRKEYPDYEVTAGTLDEFADVIWESREKLPVIETEIGDTWIHGSAADPYKSAGLRELIRLKNKWLQDGSMTRESQEYKNFTDALICIAEHTCGMDMKVYFADYENYLKKDFTKARSKDDVRIRHLFADFPQNFLIFISRTFGNHKKGSYKVIEKSWAEQREYLKKAVAALSNEHRVTAQIALRALRPEKPEALANNGNPYDTYTLGKWSFAVNKNGGIKTLSFDGRDVIKNNDKPILEYRSYTEANYDYWLEHYTRNLKETMGWAVGDFARPLLKRVKGKYPAGRFFYTVKDAAVSEGDGNVKLLVNFEIDKKLSEELGAPRLMQILYTLTEDGLSFDTSWFNKDANRLTEAMFMHLYPADGELRLTKVSDEIDPSTVASMGGRNLHAVWNAKLRKDGETFKFTNLHSPILSVGQGKILEFDNKFENFEKDGISYVLCDNVWGTNFPLWYEDNAKFGFSITKE